MYYNEILQIKRDLIQEIEDSGYDSDALNVDTDFRGIKIEPKFLDQFIYIFGVLEVICNKYKNNLPITIIETDEEKVHFAKRFNLGDTSEIYFGFSTQYKDTLLEYLLDKI